MKRIYAIVQEYPNPQFVTTLSARELDDQGDYGIEMIVKDWCRKKGYTFLDYAL